MANKQMDYSLEKRKPLTPKAAAPVNRVISTNVTRQSPQPQAKTGGAAVRKQPAKENAEGKVYTDEKIHEMTSDGYIMVYPGLWDHIPTGAHIRFLKKDDGSGKPRSERFKPGGFVRNHFTTEDGKKMLMIETRPGGARGEAGYISFPLAYEDLEILWKKYDRSAFIEIHLIYNSLAQKKQQIEDLTARVNRLESILKAVIKK